jgi:hypothetical protein
LDSSIKRFADSLFEKALTESAAALRKESTDYLLERSQTHDDRQHLSGTELQGQIRIYANHIDRTTVARLASFQSAFGEINRLPTEDEVREILDDFKATWELQIKHSTQALTNFLAARTAPPGLDVSENLRAASAYGHDRVLQDWKIWRDRIQLQRSTSSLETRPNKNVPASSSVALPESQQLRGGGLVPPGSTDLFISYSAKDTEFVQMLATDLAARGLKVWWDKWVMKVGDSLHRKIQDGITNSAWLAVVLSPHSVSSPWVEKELNSGLMKELEQKEVFVLPILYKDCQIPILLKDKIYADFRSSYKTGLSALLDRFTPRINPDLLKRLMSGSNPDVSSCYANLRPEDRKLYSNELIKKLDSSSAQERTNALIGLFVIRDGGLSTHLLKMADDTADTVRRLAVFYMGELRGKYAVATISARLSDKSQEVRAAARVAYRKITGTSA